MTGTDATTDRHQEGTTRDEYDYVPLLVRFITD